MEKIATVLSSFSHEAEESVPLILMWNGPVAESGQQNGRCAVVSPEPKSQRAMPLLLLWLWQPRDMGEQVQGSLLWGGRRDGGPQTRVALPTAGQPPETTNQQPNGWPQTHE